MNKSTNSIPREKKRQHTVLLQLLIVVAFLVLIWLSFGQNVLAPRKQGSMPERLGKLELISSVEGAEALGKVSQLHGTDFNLLEAYIASYTSGDERVTIWVGITESSDTAAELTNRMVEGIARGGDSGFSNLKRLTINQGYHNHEVFQIDGPGGQHFFYLSREHEDRVVWLRIEASDTLPILEQAVKTF